MSVERFHIPVFIRAANINRQGLKSVMPHDRKEIRVKRPLRSRDANLVRGRAAIIYLEKRWNLAQAKQRRLQTSSERQQRFGVTTRGPLPIGIGQDHMTKQMIIKAALDA